MENILELTHEEALEYFMCSDNYFTYSLPNYINFQPILDYVRGIINDLSYNDCRLDNCNASDYEDVNYKLLDNKDSNYLYRPLTIANPYLYYLTVKLITKKENWNTIQRRFELYRNEHFEVSSIPLQKNDNTNSTRVSILHWWENLEQRTIELSLEYKYMFKTDITNCYPSIYTHAIDWAIIGKKEGKKKNKNGFGAQLDAFIRGFQYGQTNGIPQGSRLFDLIVELVLGFCDYEFAQKISNAGITDYKILRYRDDFRIFSNSKEDLDAIILLMQNVFSEFNFQMNSSKTIHTEKIVRNAIKQDKLDFFQNLPLYLYQQSKNEGDEEQDINNLHDSYYKELYLILLFAEKHPNSGTVLKLLSNLNARMHKKEKVSGNIKVMIALVVEITLMCVRAHQISMSIISYLLKDVDNSTKAEVIFNIKKRFNQIPNTGAIQIWLQRITYHLDLKNEHALYDEPICTLVYGNNVKLWNFSWLKPELYLSFPYESICDLDELEKMAPYIEPNEVDCFDPYYWNVNVEDDKEISNLPF